jgi:transcription initiation factor TFIIB
MLDIKTKMENRRCSQCGNPQILSDITSGEKVCAKCGLVGTEVIVDRGAEWRAFTLKEKKMKIRTGSPISFTIYDKGLHTSFRTNKDYQGRWLNSDNRRKMRRLKRWDIRSKLHGSGMRNLSRAFPELVRLTDMLHLPNEVKERAAIIYRKALEKDMIKGHSIAEFVAASVYASCRLMKIPRSLKEVAEVSTEEKKDVSRTYRYLLRELDLKMPVDYPMKFVPSITSEVDVSRKTDRLAVMILQYAKEKKALIGKDPRGIAAAALYMACEVTDEKRSQKEIAGAAGTTEVTLRNRLKDLKKVVHPHNLLKNNLAQRGILCQM